MCQKHNNKKTASLFKVTLVSALRPYNLVLIWVFLHVGARGGQRQGEGHQSAVSWLSHLTSPLAHLLQRRTFPLKGEHEPLDLVTFEMIRRKS